MPHGGDLQLVKCPGGEVGVRGLGIDRDISDRSEATSPAETREKCMNFSCVHKLIFIAWFVLLTLIRWIVIYPVDSVIHVSNNWGLQSWTVF